MQLREKIKNTVRKRIADLKKGRAKKSLLLDILGPMKQRQRDKKELKLKLDKSKGVHKIMTDSVRALKELVPDITAQSEICAVYILYGNTLQLLDSIFLLAENGFNYAMMSLCRIVMESLDLIRLFHEDKSQKQLHDWFGYKIIGNKIARKELSKSLIMSGIDLKDIDPEELSGELYYGYSHYPHLAYTALIDTIDIFSEDIDWNKNAGVHYASHNFKMVENCLAYTLITLKLTYQKLGFLDKYDYINQVLLSNYGAHDEKVLTELAEKIKND